MVNRVALALVSVSDKTGLKEFAKGLASLGVSLLSTGGTASALREAGIAVTDVSVYTDAVEMLDGRVKTLHPKIHAGILARRNDPVHMSQLEGAAIEPIDLVVINLYPFRETVAREGCTVAQAIENIDVGGPALLRAAAKNYAHVGVVADPADYAPVLEELKGNRGALSDLTRYRLAQKAFSQTAAYDGAISSWLTARGPGGAVISEFPAQFNYSGAKAQDLRYGENPHQRAAFYRDLEPARGALANYRQLQGKELSYNNIADADAAWECVKSLDSAAACVIVKHANPCGAAIGTSAREVYEQAFSTDPTSAFGGIVAFNLQVDAATLEALSRQFVEVLIAPSYTPQALALIAARANVRVLEVPMGQSEYGFDFKRVGGGLLVQTRDELDTCPGDLKVVTRKAPTGEQMRDLLFVWRVAKFVKSNAIVFAKNGRTLGIGAGQMSRVDSARIAAIKAANAGLDLAGSAVASDAFFPFRDALEVLADAGAAAVIEPGGSVRDAEVIAAADQRGLAMVFAGTRHFRH